MMVCDICKGKYYGTRTITAYPLKQIDLCSVHEKSWQENINVWLRAWQV